MDGILTLSVVNVEGKVRTDGEFRLTASQWVELPRTPEVGLLPTWSYEVLGRDVADFQQWLKGARTTLVEYFQTHWYYTNARYFWMSR